MAEKKPFEFKQVFSARLREEDRNYLAENKVDLIPEDKDESELAGRDVLLYMAEKALTKSVNIKELNKLKTEGTKSNEIQLENVKTIEGLQQELERLQTVNKSLQESVDSIQLEKDSLQLTLDEISEQYYDLKEAYKTLEYNIVNFDKELNGKKALIVPVEPVEYAVVNAFVNKFQELSKQPVDVAKLMFDLFWRYIYKQETQIAFPFVLSPREIDNIIAEHKKEGE